MKLGGKHAKSLGYSHFVGVDITVTNKELPLDCTEVKIEIEDIPFPVTLVVHKEDVLYPLN